MGNIRHGDENARLFKVQIIQSPGLGDQMPNRPSVLSELNVMSVHCVLASNGRGHQGSQLRAVPLAFVQGVEGLTRQLRRIGAENFTE